MAGPRPVFGLLFLSVPWLVSFPFDLSVCVYVAAADFDLEAGPPFAPICLCASTRTDARFPLPRSIDHPSVPFSL
jgi:hypothetical protein